jgi:hypothetical protein
VENGSGDRDREVWQQIIRMKLMGSIRMKSLRSPRLCEAPKAPDDFFNAAKLDFVARRTLILWVDFRRRKVDVRGEMTFGAGHAGDDLSYKGKDAAWKAALRKQIPRSPRRPRDDSDTRERPRERQNPHP